MLHPNKDLRKISADQKKPFDQTSTCSYANNKLSYKKNKLETDRR